MIKQGPSVRDFDPRENRFLAALNQEDFKALMRDAKVVPLKFRKRIIRQDQRVDAVYFPLTCMFSLLVTSDDKPQVEMATIGREGVVGAVEAVQAQGSVGLNLIQIAGTAVRIEANAFRQFVSARVGVQQLINRHMYAFLRQVLYGAGCNRVHSIEERCARWLLMTHDRAGQDTFPLTQEFLSHMLGVRRATVNVATGMLKKAGFIQYVRGKLTIIDRLGLESAACECYKAILKIYAALIPDQQKSEQ